MFTTRLTKHSKGRQLDVTDLGTDVAPGQTTYVCIPRLGVLELGTKELLAIMQQDNFDCCNPLEVDFIGEGNKK